MRTDVSALRKKTQLGQHHTWSMPSSFCPRLELRSSSGIGTEMVDIYVGPSKKRFQLYKAKLCTRIPYFDKMFNGNFKEASVNVAYLDDDPASFDLLADWVLVRKVLVRQGVINNHHRLRSPSIARREEATTQQRNAQRAEVVRRDHPIVSVRPRLTLRHDLTLYRK